MPKRISPVHDLVIRNGTVVDGSGDDARMADVAIDGERISTIGTELAPGRREIDATGLLVTPGWVDIHTHYDGQATWDPHLTPSGWNGVTTVVMGNCGVGFAPVAPGKQEYLIQLMEGVEDIPGSALAEGIAWSWETFPEYLNALEKMPRSVDIGAQIPHGAVRAYVMGERGASNQPATTEDIAKMSVLVKEGLQAGALGFSSSRTLVHRAKDGQPVPGTFAPEDELFGIGSALGDVGHGVFEVASDLAEEDGELAWMRELSRRSGRPVTFACLENDYKPDQWRRLLAACEEDALAGGRVTPQVAQRPAGILMGLQSTIHPFVAHPAYIAISGLPLAERVSQMRRVEVRDRILSEKPVDLSRAMLRLFQTPDRLFVLGDPPDYEPGPEKSVKILAEQECRQPDEVIYDLLLEDEGRNFLYRPNFGYAQGDFEALREMMMHPLAVFGLSDGGAHCGLITDASVPTFLLTHWVRDRSRGARIPLERIVHSQTRRTAQLFDLHDRGLIAQGMLADINLIDFDGLYLHPPQMVYDLPGESRRLIQEVEGYRFTIKRGTITFEDGKPTGAMPAKLIRGPQQP